MFREPFDVHTTVMMIQCDVWMDDEAFVKKLDSYTCVDGKHRQRQQVCLQQLENARNFCVLETRRQ